MTVPGDAALASYAKQADDETLFKSAMRIKGRAVRRVGELLKEIEPAKTGPKPQVELGRGALPKQQTRESIAARAGISDHQQKQALRIASIPKREFEQAIEAEKPPTLTALAKQGTVRDAILHSVGACRGEPVRFAHAQRQTMRKARPSRWLAALEPIPMYASTPQQK